MKRFLSAIVFMAFIVFANQNACGQTVASGAIIATIVSGTITTCQGTASASPNIQQFTVSGSNLTTVVAVTAPQGFEVSLISGSGYGSSVTLNPSSGTLSNTTVYVRAASSAAVDNISGNVTLSSAGAANQTVAVTGTVKELPKVNPVANQTITNGAKTTAINFSGSSNTVFNWVNDTPGIGLPAKGSGDITSFTAVNNGTSTITATITATPVSEGFAYIANEGEGTLSVINVATNNIMTTLTPQHDPFCVCISPDGSKAYIGCGDGSSTVAVVNTTTNTIINTIPVSSSGESTGITVSPDGSRLYIANYVNNTVSIVNTATNAVVAVIPVAQSPYGIAISPDGSKVYVAFAFTNYVSVISTATNTVTGTITVGMAPPDVAVGPDGKVYVPVTNSNKVCVVDPVSNNIIATIPTASGPGVINLSPDGTRAYVAVGLTNIAVINTSTDAVIATIQVGSAPNGISVSPDGDFVYVTNTESKTVSVINASTNKVVATVAVGISPVSLGNFVTGGTGCTGVPTNFTITVNPTPRPTITTGTVSGNIYTCLGTASVSPNIQQFTVSGTNLTGDINMAAPSGFEISTSPEGSYTTSLSLTQTAGSVGTTIVYVRTAATAPAGNLTGMVTLTSPGATTMNVAVQGDVFATPTINPVPSQTVISGSQTTTTYFTGAAENFNWVNDNPAIGLPASGSGNIAAFTAINNSNASITATITVTPLTSYGASEGSVACTGIPVTFTITVNPVPPSRITAEGDLSPLNTTYGTPSSSTSLNISGTSLTGGILVKPPAGFEESTDNITFAPTLTLGTGGTVPTTSVYIRLAAITPVGEYSGNIVLSGGSAAPVDVAMPVSTVNPAPLTITADNKSRLYGTENPLLTASYSGFVNGQGPEQLTSQPQLSTVATSAYPVGEYPIVVSGASSPNYTFNYIAGVLTIEPQGLVIPNAFTPNGDGINDTWNIKYLENYPNCRVSIFSRYGERLYFSIGYPIPWDGKYKGADVPPGTYYYIIDTNSNPKTYSGYVTVIR